MIDARLLFGRRRKRELHPRRWDFFQQPSPAHGCGWGRVTSVGAFLSHAVAAAISYHSPNRARAGLVSARVAALFSTLRDFSFTSPAPLRFLPQPLRLNRRIDPVLFPPLLFRADIMERSVMKQAKRHRPFVARLARQRARLRKPGVMRLARRPRKFSAVKGARCSDAAEHKDDAL